MNLQAGVAARRVPDAAGIRYLPLYPPQVSILFAPLARLSYGWALAAWWSSSALIYGVCCWSVWRSCPNLRDHGGMVVILAAAFPAFFHLIAWGQTSAVALGCFTLAFFLLRDRREFLAGVVLGCLVFKPQLGLAAAIVFVALGAWKIVAGAVLSSAAQLSAGVLYYGMEPLRQWLRIMWSVRSLLTYLEPRPYQTHCLRTFWSMIVPWSRVAFGLYVMSAILILALTMASWRSRRGQPLTLPYSALLFTTVLVAPHLTVYDLVILVPALLLLADWLIGEPQLQRNKGMGTLLYLVCILPLGGPLARWTHLQPSVLAIALLVWMISQVSLPGKCEKLPLAEQEP